MFAVEIEAKAQTHVPLCIKVVMKLVAFSLSSIHYCIHRQCFVVLKTLVCCSLIFDSR